MSKYVQRQRSGRKRDGNSAVIKVGQAQQCDLIGAYSKLVSYIKSIHGTPKEVVKEVFERQKYAEKARATEYKSAAMIQAWYRGITTRRYFKKLKSSAIVIQKAWRGYTGRVYSNMQIRSLVEVCKMNFYNVMATKIQKTWRGFCVRKYVHDFYARSRYFQLLVIKNQIVRRELAKFKEESVAMENLLEQKKMESDLEAIARKKHYLVSTFQKPSIYNSPFRKFPHEMEDRLRRAKPLSMKPRVFPKFNCGNCDEFLYSKKPPHPPKDALPPARKRLQGPFKPLAQVREQRNLPLNPSLRVSTDYQSVENARMKLKKQEWLKRVQDLPFMLVAKSNSQHERLLHTDSDYSYDIHENKFCMRHERPEKHVSEKRMQTVVSPIPVFDRLGQTYTKGAVLLQ